MAHEFHWGQKILSLAGSSLAKACAQASCALMGFRVEVARSLVDSRLFWQKSGPRLLSRP